MAYSRPLSYRGSPDVSLLHAIQGTAVPPFSRSLPASASRTSVSWCLSAERTCRFHNLRTHRSLCRTPLLFLKKRYVISAGGSLRRLRLHLRHPFPHGVPVSPRYEAHRQAHGCPDAHLYLPLHRFRMHHAPVPVKVAYHTCNFFHYPFSYPIPFSILTD